MAEETRCRPPAGTKLGSLHWLRDASGRQKLAVWVAGDRWRFTGPEHPQSEAEAAAQGWHYDALAAPL